MDTVIIFIRQLLLFAHTLAFAFAFVTIVREDISLLKIQRIDIQKLKNTARSISYLLSALWATGVALILLDTGVDLTALIEKPKLAAKLTVVITLTINGFFLHKIAFPMLMRGPAQETNFAATICSLLGAISSVSWTYAAFLGVARIIAPAMHYTDFIGLYFVALAGGITIAIVFVKSHIRSLLRGDMKEQKRFCMGFCR